MGSLDAPSLAAIVLAAGASARLGQSKQFVQYQGEPLLRRAVRLACEADASPVHVVLREEHRATAEDALHGLAAACVVNAEPASGMGSSLRTGMAALLQSAPVPERVLLLVCDQPHITLQSLDRLLAVAAPDGIAAAGYAGRLGVPAVFSAAHYAALATVAGDHGARALLRTLPCTVVPMPEAEADLDTPQDLALLTPVH